MSEEYEHPPGENINNTFARFATSSSTAADDADHDAKNQEKSLDTQQKSLDTQALAHSKKEDSKKVKKRRKQSKERDSRCVIH
jgi:hypothetical protein